MARTSTRTKIVLLIVLAFFAIALSRPSHAAPVRRECMPHVAC